MMARRGSMSANGHGPSMETPLVFLSVDLLRQTVDLLEHIKQALSDLDQRVSDLETRAAPQGWG